MQPSARGRNGHGPDDAAHPNVYDLSNDDTTIRCGTTSLDGSPRLSYSGPKAESSYSGDQIESMDTALGTEVVVEDIADLHVVTLPEMWIAPHEGPGFKTIAVYATREEPITAPVGLPAARGRGMAS